MNSRRKKSFKKKSKKKSNHLKKNIDNKIKRQSKIIRILETYIQDINKLEKTIHHLEKNINLKKSRKIKKSIRNSNLRHDVPFDISMIKPNYQKTKRTMLEQQIKTSIKNQTNNFNHQYSDIDTSFQNTPIILSPQTYKKIPQSAKLYKKSTNKLQTIDEKSNETSSSSSYSPSESGSGSETGSESGSESESESPRRKLNL
jgi:hypothetical protein